MFIFDRPIRPPLLYGRQLLPHTFKLIQWKEPPTLNLKRLICVCCDYIRVNSRLRWEMQAKYRFVVGKHWCQFSNFQTSSCQWTGPNRRSPAECSTNSSRSWNPAFFTIRWVSWNCSTCCYYTIAFTNCLQSVNESRIRLAVYRAVDSALDSYSRTVEEVRARWKIPNLLFRIYDTTSSFKMFFCPLGKTKVCSKD